MFFKIEETGVPLTGAERIQLMERLLESLENWRKLGNIQEPCFPPSFLEALTILFPKGV